MTDLYLDCEWFLNQELFIIGYAYSVNNYGQLYDKKLNVRKFKKLLAEVDGFIYFYGPDIAMIEKNFNINLRDNFDCINLLPLMKHYKPNLSCHKLVCLEEYYDIQRSTVEFKNNIFRLLHNWNNPIYRHKILKYNQEDVINLVRIRRKATAEHNLTRNKILQFKLK